MKNVKFKMKITPEIGHNKVIAFSEKCPGSEDGETAKLSDGTLPLFGSQVSREKQGRQQPNADVGKGSQDIEFFSL